MAVSTDLQFIAMCIISISIILLMLTLFLLALCCGWHLLLLRPPLERGLDEKTIRSLPLRLHLKNSQSPAEEEEMCAICLGNFVEGKKVKVLPVCSHYFHRKCIDRWLRVKELPGCPVCRQPVAPLPAEPHAIV